MRVSHETIYRSLFIQSRGALRRELTKHLRTGRTVRRPKGHRGLKGKGGGQLTNVVHISERPAEVEDRAVPGHWEGDLLLGKAMSGISTLVERSTRFVLLVKLERIDSQAVLAALARHILTLPEQLRRSLTWDQGKEMARHAQFTIDTGIQIYFCDPKSPWQRGSNENTVSLGARPGKRVWQVACRQRGMTRENTGRLSGVPGVGLVSRTAGTDLAHSPLA
jgi:IS30 family transposase